jgi:hypothetical protein
MTSNPILPIVPEGAAPVDDSTADDGETTDSESTVDEDLREGDDVNEKLDE